MPNILRFNIGTDIATLESKSRWFFRSQSVSVYVYIYRTLLEIRKIRKRVQFQIRFGNDYGKYSSFPKRKMMTVITLAHRLIEAVDS